MDCIVPATVTCAPASGGITFPPLDSDGARKEVKGCDFYTFRMGKVIRKDSYWKIVE